MLFIEDKEEVMFTNLTFWHVSCFFLIFSHFPLYSRELVLHVHFYILNVNQHINISLVTKNLC